MFVTEPQPVPDVEVVGVDSQSGHDGERQWLPVLPLVALASLPCRIWGKEKLDSIPDIQNWFTSTWVMSRGNRSMHLTDITVNINLWYKNSCRVTICID